MVDSYVVSVNSTAPVLVCHAPEDAGNRKAKIYVANLSATSHVYLGDNGVTSATGYEIVNQSGQTIGYRQEFELFGGEELYAICASGQTASLSVIISGN